LDSKLRTPARARLLSSHDGSAPIIATTQHGSAAKERALVKAGAQVWRFKARPNGHVPLDQLVRELGNKQITSLLVEGGGQTHASFLEAGLVDQAIVYVAPKVVGGHAPSWVGGKGIASLAAAYRFEFVGEPVALGDDLRLHVTRIEH
jgi:diaminohydroxyphosphoribosylaminopyrimidine deaminase/5-amino-6-(5-phosphoribosylamino)uracil reductase